MESISICIGRKGSKGLPGKNTMTGGRLKRLKK